MNLALKSVFWVLLLVVGTSSVSRGAAGFAATVDQIAGGGTPTVNIIANALGASRGDGIRAKPECQIVGGNCELAQKMGCDKLVNSVISGTVECWSSDKKFVLKKEDGTPIDGNHYESVANLIPNTTGEKLIIAKSDSSRYSSLLDESGKVVINGEQLGCDNYRSLGEGQISCIRGKQSFPLNLSDIRKAKKASLRVGDAADSISLNLCGIALNQGDSVFSNKHSFAQLGSYQRNGRSVNKSIEIYTGKSSYGSHCTMEPYKDQSCTAIYLNKEGLECYAYGQLMYKQPLRTSKEDMAKALKKYVFNNKEIVSMNDLLNQTQNRYNSNSQLRVDRPDLLMTTSMVNSSGSGSSVGGSTGGVSGGK